MCSIGAGLVAGKEGPFIQCGASIAWLLACGSDWLGGVLSRHQLRGGGSSSSSRGRNRAASAGAEQAASGAASLSMLGLETEYSRASGSVACSVNAAACEQQQSAAATDQELRLQRQQHEVQQEACRMRRLLHDAAAMGAGAGVAAAFIAPMAGESRSATCGLLREGLDRCTHPATCTNPNPPPPGLPPLMPVTSHASALVQTNCFRVEGLALTLRLKPDPTPVMFRCCICC